MTTVSDNAGSATEIWIGVIVAASALLGALIGGGISHLSQRIHRRQERLDEHAERLRSAYASWAGALRRRVEAERLQLSFVDEIQPKMTLIQSDKDVALQAGMDMRDLVRAAIDAKTNEEIAFVIVLLTDTNPERVARTQRIRDMSPIEIAFASGDDAVERLASFENAGIKQSKALSEFLCEISNELDPVTQGHH